MQNYLEITSKSQFGIRNVGNWTKSRNLDMSGPAKASPGGQVLVSKAGFLFFYFLCFILLVICLVIEFIFMLLMENSVFGIPRHKTLQNHYEITSKSQFWTRNVRNLTKTCPYGPIWARPGPLKSVWAWPGPLKSGKDPARSLEEREKLRKNAPFLF